jgi:uncharacterized protein YbaA (DUF1428 family)
VVVLAWITYPTRAARDEINAKVFADPRLAAHMTADVFDTRRMIYGGFESFMEL